MASVLKRAALTLAGMALAATSAVAAAGPAYAFPPISVGERCGVYAAAPQGGGGGLYIYYKNCRTTDWESVRVTYHANPAVMRCLPPGITYLGHNTSTSNPGYILWAGRNGLCLIVD
ncbi:DUF6355 family natural product biosynthesis protein [Rhizohabitans arisaemae]|uniref:DUF6355 family natural product biosynthesis protein n=1 Tax=Rhizohabitans arisaemae TaxID=2720610 RepID=UPI0024B07C16|nr:DUF6355 family natural product biosynthesis protein [Rhizohabitans arisaemae]